MKMSGSHTLPAPREQVWKKLNDPDVLRRCIPGCESLEKHGEDKLAAVVNVKIGPMNTRFNGEVELKDLNPPESYRIEGTGSGGQAGSASGGADVRLADKGNETELTYDVDARVSGMSIGAYQETVHRLRARRDRLEHRQSNLRAWLALRDPFLAGGYLDLTMDALPQDGFALNIPAEPEEDGTLLNRHTESLRAAMEMRAKAEQNIEAARRLLRREDELTSLQVLQLERVLYQAASDPQTVPELVEEKGE